MDPTAFQNQLVVPRSNPYQYEQAVDLLFDTVKEAKNWLYNELDAYAGDLDELAYIKQWVLCQRILFRVGT
jgi:hypothetical protein